MPHEYFIYLRKSTDREDVQVQSIESQKEICEAYARQNNMRIAGTIREKESAKTPGRPLFNDMLARIRDGDAQGILAYHPDRLARNSKDGGEIVYLLDTGELKDLKFPTFWFENTPQGKFMLGMEFVQSKRYTDNLSVVTKRGLQQKARNGVYPSNAPRGYLNDVRTKTIVVDPELAPVIKRMFALYAQGGSTLEDLQRFLTENGIISQKTRRHPGGKPLHIELIRGMLRNPFYYGDFRYSGEIFEGSHQPLISKSLYDQVQKVIELRTHKISKKHYTKPFMKLFKCSTCGLSISAEMQKGHTYYRCTKKSKKVICNQPYVREEEIAAQLSTLLLQFSLSEGEADELLTQIEAERSNVAGRTRLLLTEKRNALESVQESLKRLTELYVGQTISRPEFLEKQVDFHSQKKNLMSQIRQIEDRSGFWLEPMRSFVKSAQNVAQIAKNGTLLEKKSLAIEVFGSNLVLDHRKVVGTALKPWFFVGEMGSQRKMVPRHGLEP